MFNSFEYELELLSANFNSVNYTLLSITLSVRLLQVQLTFSAFSLSLSLSPHDFYALDKGLERPKHHAIVSTIGTRLSILVVSGFRVIF